MSLTVVLLFLQPDYSHIWFFCLTIYEKRPRWAKFFKLPQCLQRKPKHFLQSASSCTRVHELSCWIWQQSLAWPCESLEEANRSQSGALLHLSCLCSISKGQECATLMYLLFGVFFVSWFFMWTDVSHCSWCWAAAVWGVDQKFALLFLWVIRRIELTGRARKYQALHVCVSLCVCWTTRVPSTQALASCFALSIMHSTSTALYYSTLQLCVWDQYNSTVCSCEVLSVDDLCSEMQSFTI